MLKVNDRVWYKPQNKMDRELGTIVAIGYDKKYKLRPHKIRYGYVFILSGSGRVDKIYGFYRKILGIKVMVEDIKKNWVLYH